MSSFIRQAVDSGSTWLPRKGIRPALTLTDLYVLASRVQLGDRLYVLGFDPSEESNHLRKLTPSAALGIWHLGYDDAGKWDARRAARAADQLSERKKEATSAKRRRPTVGTAALTAADASPRRARPRPNLFAGARSTTAS